jgi:O-antigen/teichoic acid export membrane protein
VNEVPTTLAGDAVGAGVAERGGVRAHLRDPLHRTGYLLVLGAGVGSLLGFLFWALAAHAYTARVVGLYSAVISAMLLTSGACQLGLNAVLVRYLPRAGPSARTLVLRSYTLTVAISLVVGAAVAATSELWSPRLGFLARDPGWFAGFVVGTALWTLFTLQDSVMVGLKAVGWVPVENSIYSLLKLVLLVAFVGLLPFSGPFVAWNLPLAGAVVIVTVFVFAQLVPRHAERDPQGSVDRRQILSVARGNYGGTLFSLASTMLLPILVANTAGAEQTAYFYIPWTVAVGLQLIALNMTTSLTVEAALDEERTRELTRRALRLTMSLVVPLAALTALVAPWGLRVFSDAYADAGVTLLRLLALAAVPNVIILLGLAVARIQHRGPVLLVIQGAQCVLALGLSAALLPGHGIEGVGVAWLVSQVAVAGALLAGLLRPLLFTTGGAGPGAGARRGAARRRSP